MSTKRVNEFNHLNKSSQTKKEFIPQTDESKMCQKTNNESKEKKNYFLSTIKNTSKFIVISLITKVLNLIINIFVIRKVTKQSFGIAKIYFESAYLMLQYFPLETMRKTTQKYCCSVENEKLESIRFEQCSRVMWLLNFIFAILTIPVWYLYVTYGENLSDVSLQMFLHLVCSNLELYVEPIMLYCNVKFFNNYRLVLNTIGNYTRVFTTFILVIFFDMELWGFTLARMLSTTAYCLYALYINYKDLKLKATSIFPFISALGYKDDKELEAKEFDDEGDSRVKKSELKNSFQENFFYYFFFKNSTNIFNPLLKEIFMSFVYINILKMILTYTEKIFLSFFIRFHETEKSEYSFVTDNFAILIRFFLEPLETNFFNLINKIKAPAEETNSGELNTNTKIKTDENNSKRSRNDNYYENEELKENEFLDEQKINEFEKKKKITVRKMMNILNLFLRFLLIFGFLLVGYIFTIGKEVFMLVFGSAWITDSAINILRNYSVYIFIISINGVLEAFCNAIANARQMKLFNKMMILNSICLISFSILLNEYSVLGLIYANGLAMIFRILGNIYIIFSTDCNGISSNKLDLDKKRFFAAKKEQANGAYDEFYILENLREEENKGKTSKYIYKQIARQFFNSLLSFRSFVAYVICVCFVSRISHFNFFKDNNFRMLLIINNNFIKVVLSGLVFLVNVFIIYLFERNHFKRIYNESV